MLKILSLLLTLNGLPLFAQDFEIDLKCMKLGREALVKELTCGLELERLTAQQPTNSVLLAKLNECLVMVDSLCAQNYSTNLEISANAKLFVKKAVEKKLACSLESRAIEDAFTNDQLIYAHDDAHTCQSNLETLYIQFLKM
jgi:hypothetical protein